MQTQTLFTMKRLSISVLFVLLCSSLSAQTIKHTEYNEQGQPITFYEGLSECFREGLPIVVRAGVSTCETTFSYNASAALQLGGFRGLYFAPEIGIDSRGINGNNSIARGNLVSVEAHSLMLRPVQVGYAYAFYKYCIDFHAALYKSFDFDYDVRCMLDPDFDGLVHGPYEPVPTYNTGDWGWSAGVGFYFYRFNIDLLYNNSLTPMFENNPFKANILSARLGLFF